MKLMQASLNVRKEQEGSLLWRSCEARASLLSVRKELECSFHHCGGPMKLMQACLCVGMTLQSRVNRRAGDVKHVQPCLSTKKD